MRMIIFWPLAGLLGLALAAMVSGAEEPGDWRLELLAEEGVSPETAKLQELREGFSVSEERLEQAAARLGADEFAVREQAERDILLMGTQALPWLNRLPRSKDPEVRARLAGIERALRAKGQWSKDDLMRYAIESLLRERLDGKDAPAEIIFAEFFRRASPSLADGYRRFGFEAPKGMTGLVAGGVLRMKGNRPGDGDQRLLVTAEELTGKDEFPTEFRVEAKLGGEAGGEGGYHIGVSVGNVRALFHPGNRGGAFRFEQIDNHKYLTTNAQMGFDPSTEALQLMSIDVKRLAGGKVEMKVAVTSGDGTRSFDAERVLEADEIGKLDAIGLDRSGRTGGDAVFDVLVVVLGGR